MRQRPMAARVAVRCIASESYVGMCPHCTGMFAPDFTSGLPEDAVRALRAGEVLPAGTTLASVAGAAAFLLSDAASSITGQTLAVDAGASA